MQETIYRMHLGPTLVNDAVKRLQDKGFVAFSGSEYTYVRVMEDEAISRHSIARAVDISGLRPWDIEVHNRQDVLTIGGFWIFAFDKKTGYEYGRVWADVNNSGVAEMSSSGPGIIPGKSSADGGDADATQTTETAPAK